MAMQTIKNGGFVAEEISKINANFSEIENDYAKQTDIPTVPTKTSDLENDSNFATADAIPTKTSDLENDSNFATTSDVTNAAPTKVTFTTSSWSSGTFTTASNGKNPSVVMRKNGSNYGIALVDVKVSGSNVVITSDESFEGYLILV